MWFEEAYLRRVGVVVLEGFSKASRIAARLSLLIKKRKHRIPIPANCLTTVLINGKSTKINTTATVIITTFITMSFLPAILLPVTRVWVRPSRRRGQKIEQPIDSTSWVEEIEEDQPL